MTNIVKLKIKRPVSRQQAIQFLASSKVEFPVFSENKPCGDDIFYGWRFILATDGIVYFANCIEPGICENELKAYLQFA